MMTTDKTKIVIGNTDFNFHPAHHEAIYKAYEFAENRHRGQMRKYSNQPYIVHPVRVAKHVFSIAPRADFVIAALFHDLVEDTNTTNVEILNMFGYQVSTIVSYLTKPVTIKGVNRKKRTEQYVKQLSMSNDAAKLIKYCDILDNVTSIAENDPGFARLYINESLDKFRVIQDCVYLTQPMKDQFLSTMQTSLDKSDCLNYYRSLKPKETTQ